jgi:hypothetical protein
LKAKKLPVQGVNLLGELANGGLDGEIRRHHLIAVYCELSHRQKSASNCHLTMGRLKICGLFLGN